MQKRRYAILVSAGALAGCSWLFGGSNPVVPVEDGFESGTLDGSKWTTSQIWFGDPHEPPQLSFPQGAARCGQRHARVISRPGQRGKSPEDAKNMIERAELRESDRNWPVWGETVWYGFSFRVEGDIPAPDSPRTMIGQWKSPGDDSPFFAQRYDNGIFHITVQDGPARRTVACAPGNPHETSEADAYRRDYGCFQQPYYDQFPTDLSVMPGTNPVLPDPSTGWVDMQYGIRGGNRNSEVGPMESGSVEIWANGNLVATVQGDFGSPLKAGAGRYQYFKFGVYRDLGRPDPLIFHLDEFRRGSRRADVVPRCAREADIP